MGTDESVRHVKHLRHLRNENTDSDMYTFEPGILKREGGHYYKNVSGTLRANAGDNQMSVSMSAPCPSWRKIGALCEKDYKWVQNQQIDQGKIIPCYIPINTVETQKKAYCIDHVICGGGNSTAQGKCWYEEVTATLKAGGVHAVCCITKRKE